MKTISVSAYEFTELSERAKDRARQDYCECHVCLDWYRYAIEHVKETCARFGLHIEDVRFTGFHSQGDGASFIGTCYREDDTGALIQDDTVRVLAERLRNTDARSARMAPNQSGYAHEYSVFTEAYADNNDTPAKDSEEVASIMQNLMRWAHGVLEQEYEGITSDETIAETYTANDVLFDAHGHVLCTD